MIKNNKDEKQNVRVKNDVKEAKSILLYRKRNQLIINRRRIHLLILNELTKIFFKKRIHYVNRSNESESYSTKRLTHRLMRKIELIQGLIGS